MIGVFLDHVNNYLKKRPIQQVIHGLTPKK